MPLHGHFSDHHFVRTVMEVKRHLLRCVRNMKPHASNTPDIILVDAGANNHDIKSELERWMERHPRLQRIKVVFPSPRPWVVRAWKRSWGWLNSRWNPAF